MKKTLLAGFLILASSIIIAQECTDLFISEYVEGSGNNKAIELYNPTNEAINLETYNLVRYSNGDFVPYAVQLSGIIQPKSAFVAVLDKRDPNGTGQEVPVDEALQLKADIFLCPVYDINRMMYFNGNDAVTLEKTTGEIVDIFAQIGPPMLADDNGWGNLNDTTITYNSGGNPTQYTIQNYIVGPLFWLAWTKDHTLLRKTNVSEGIRLNPNPYFVVDVQWDSLPENTFDSLGSHFCDCTTFGFGDNMQQTRLDVFPNPVLEGKFSIESEEPIALVELIDLSGKIVKQLEIDGRVNTYQFASAEKFRGIFMVRVSLQSGEIITRKLLFK